MHLLSHLFTLRLWRESATADGAEQQDEIRMQVRSLANGETRYFRDWQTLIAYLEGYWADPDQDASNE